MAYRVQILEPDTKEGIIKRGNNATTAVFTFGRFNPPTVGHQKMIRKLLEVGEEKNADVYVFGSHTKDKKKNPLTHKQKMKHMTEMFSEMGGYVDPGEQIRTALDAAVYLNEYDNLVMVVGEDRVDSFRSLLERYNGKEMKKGEYDFQTIEVVNAGIRDPDSDGLEGMSASKMREAVMNDDMETFRSGVPLNYDAKEMFANVKKGMGIN